MNWDRPRFVATLLAIAQFGLPSLAEAHPFFDRYLVCNLDDDEVTPASAPAVSDTGEFAPLPRRRFVPEFEPTPIVIADLLQPNPIGTGSQGPSIAVTTFQSQAGSLDYRCIGLPRGKAGMLRVVGGPMLKRYRGEPQAFTTIIRHAAAAGVFNVRETLPAIRAKFERPIPDSLEPWMEAERLRLKVELSKVLADFGDRSLAPALRDFLVEREGKEFPGYWEDALESLTRLDPDLATEYAKEALERIAKTKDPGVPEESRLRKLLPVLQKPDGAALSVLTRLHHRKDPKEEGHSHEDCLLMQARIRSGDTTLAQAIAPDLAGNLLTQRGANCYSELIEVIFPGTSSAEVDTLLYRVRYESLLRLVIRMRQEDSAEARKAKQKILAWLTERLQVPEIGGGAGDRRYNLEARAIHLALMVALGAKNQEKVLFDLIRDPADESTGPWLAVIAALDLGLAGAEEAAVERLRLAHTHDTERFSRDSWPGRGDITVTEHGQVVDRLVARNNEGFVLGLLDRQINTRHLTAYHLARKLPASACKTVVAAAQGASDDAIRDAFWVLTVLGDECRDEFEAAALSRQTTEDARSMAVEARAMLRTPEDKKPSSPFGKVLLTPPSKYGTARAAWERARDTLRSHD